jgi:hypothetical protein
MGRNRGLFLCWGLYSVRRFRNDFGSAQLFEPRQPQGSILKVVALKEGVDG